MWSAVHPPAGGRRPPREEDLGPVAVDFAANPLMMVLGDTRSGKSKLLRHVIRGPGELPPPNRCRLTVVDRRRSWFRAAVHRQHTPPTSTGSPRRCWTGYADRGCRPRSGCPGRPLNIALRRSGEHTHYLIIDDVDAIPDGPAMSGLYPGLKADPADRETYCRGRDLGSWAIVTARATGPQYDDQLRRCAYQRPAGYHGHAVGQPGRQRPDPVALPARMGWARHVVRRRRPAPTHL